jgi:hypothetical protein
MEFNDLLKRRNQCNTSSCTFVIKRGSSELNISVPHRNNHTSPITMATGTIDMYQQQRMHYRKVMMINNEGVQLLYNGNIEGAISTFRDGIILARNLLLYTRATILRNTNCNINSVNVDHPPRHVHTPLLVMNGNIENYTALSSNISDLADYNGRLISTCRIVDRQSQHYVQQQQNLEWLDMLCTVIASASLSSSFRQVYMPLLPRMKSRTMQQTYDADSAISAEILQCRMGTSLIGLKADNYYIHDRPFLFSDDYIEQRCCPTNAVKSSNCRHDVSTPINTEEIIRTTTVLIVNIAMTYHCQGKMYGSDKSYTNAIEMYYLLWTVSQSSCTAVGPIYSMKDRWYTTIQSVLLNNLVHVHNELENYLESKICITCLYDLIVWKSSQQGGIANDTVENDEYSIGTSTEDGDNSSSFSNENDVGITYERINRMSLLQKNEFDQIMANIIYYRTPDTARAA